MSSLFETPEWGIVLAALIGVFAVAGWLAHRLQRTMTRWQLQTMKSGVEQEKQHQMLQNEKRLQNELFQMKKQQEALQEQLDKVQQEKAAAHSSISHLTTQYHEARDQLALNDSRYAELQEKHQQLLKHHTELETSLQAKQEHFDQQFQQLADNKVALSKEFENLANKIFDEKGKAFQQNSENSIGHLLKPLSEQIEGFQKRVNDVHTHAVKENANLGAEIQKVLQVGLKMKDEANHLVTALKGDKKLQGTWGEIQAELLLEMSGLHKGREYDREAQFTNEEGKHQRPDFIVYLPNNKHLIIDSKVSLNAFTEAVAADNEAEKLRHLKAHATAIRKHVNDLSAKNYPKLKDLNSPDFVFMFIGNEPAYLAALETDATLMQDAYYKGIGIVTPNTLLSSLRLVSHLWSIDKQNANTLLLAEQASKVYDKLRVFLGKMDKLGQQINTMQKTYDDSVISLTDGRGSLLQQVDKFRDMGVTVKERLPTPNEQPAIDADDSPEPLAYRTMRDENWDDNDSYVDKN